MWVVEHWNNTRGRHVVGTCACLGLGTCGWTLPDHHVPNGLCASCQVVSLLNFFFFPKLLQTLVTVMRCY